MKPQILISMGVLILTTLACSLIQVNVPDKPSDPADPPVAGTQPLEGDPIQSEGDPAQGELLFTGQAGGELSCSNCHSLQPGQTLVGPSLAGIGTTAATRIEGYSAEEYLQESIEQPNTYVVEGFRPDIMPENFGKRMSDEDLVDLIAYLMTLE